MLETISNRIPLNQLKCGTEYTLRTSEYVDVTIHNEDGTTTTEECYEFGMGDVVTINNLDCNGHFVEHNGKLVEVTNGIGDFILVAD